MERSRLATPKKLVLIVVNAAVHRGAESNKKESIPGMVTVLDQLTDNWNDRIDYQSLELFRQTLEDWRRQAINKASGGAVDKRPDYYLVTVNFEKLSDPNDRTFFEDLPTSFHLPSSTVDKLTEVGRSLLRQSNEYQRLLRDLGR
jgi:NTE family protein